MMAAAGAGKQARVATGPWAGGVEPWRGGWIVSPCARARQRVDFCVGTKINLSRSYPLLILWLALIRPGKRT